MPSLMGAHITITKQVTSIMTQSQAARGTRGRVDREPQTQGYRLSSACCLLLLLEEEDFHLVTLSPRSALIVLHAQIRLSPRR